MVDAIPAALTPDEPEPFDPEPWVELASDLIEGKGELTPKWLGSAATLVATTFGGPWAGAITGTLATALAVALGTTGTARFEAAEKEYAQRETLQQDVTRAVVTALQTEGRRLFEAARGEREMGKTTLAHAMVQGLLWLEQRGQLQSSELQAAIATNADRLSEQSASEFVETIKYILQQEEATRRQIGAQLNEGFARLEQLLSAVLQSLGEQRPGAARAMLRRQLPDRDPRFVGRETELEDLHQRLGQTLAVGVTQRLATWGHGGLGKSSLAIEYAWRHASSYPGGVLFLHAKSNVSVALAAWAPLYGVAGDRAAGRDVAELARAVRAALSDGEPALLIVDNVPDAAWLREHRDELPSRACRLVFTTRASQLPAVTMLPLDRLDDAAAKRLLAAYRADAADPNASSAVETIVRLTGGLAVAVVTVGAYLARLPQLSWDRYAKSLGRRGLRSYERTAEETIDALNYPPSIAVIFGDLYGELSPSEQRALDYAALLGAASFPEFWLETLLAQEPSADSEALPGFEDAPGASVLAGLKEARVLRVESAEHGVRFLSIHALLRDWLQQNGEHARRLAELRDPVLHLAGERAIAVHTQGLLNQALRLELTPLVAIARELTQSAQTEAAAVLTAWLCPPLLEHARRQEANDLLAPFIEETGHSLDEAAFDLGATLVSNLGMLLQAEGDYPTAIARTEQAIAILEKHGEADHPRLAEWYSNLAMMTFDLGNFAKAKPYLEQAISSSEKHHGADNPQLAVIHSNLGLVLWHLGHPAEAATRLERGVALAETHYPSNHPTLAVVLSNLASTVMIGQGDYAGAQAHLERALAIEVEHRGPHHPTVAKRYSNLSQAHSGLQHFTAAREVLEKAIAIGEGHYPLDHPALATLYSNLGVVLTSLQDFATAKTRLEQAAAIVRKRHGANHPELAAIYSSLGVALLYLGNISGAKTTLEEAIAIDKQHLAPNHPVFANRYSNLAAVLVRVGHQKRACQLLRQAQEILAQHVPATHPDLLGVSAMRDKYCGWRSLLPKRRVRGRSRRR